ncbi:MAG: molybdenum cofactor guanylyltransferase [Eubacterium sp.]
MNRFGTAAILVGGKSSRMGFDKKYLKIAGKNILQVIIDQLKEIFEEVIIVGCKPEVVADVKGFSHVYEDALPLRASLTGIYTSLLHGQSQYIYITACDMPNYNGPYIDYMKKKLEFDQIRGCVTCYEEWIEPFNAFYSKDLLVSMADYIGTGRKSVFKYLETQEIFYVEEILARKFSPKWDMFCNLNRPKDIEKYLRGIYYGN